MKRVVVITAVLLSVATLAMFLGGRSQSLSDRWQWHDGELSPAQVDSVVAALQQQSLPVEVFDSKDLPGWLGSRLSRVVIAGKAAESTSEDLSQEERVLIRYAGLLSGIHGIGSWADIPGWYQRDYLSGPEPLAADYLKLCRLWFKRGAAVQWQLSHFEQRLLAAMVGASTVGPDACQSQQQLVALYRAVNARQDGIGWLAPAALQHLWLQLLEGRYSAPVPLPQRLSTLSDVIRLLASDNEAEQLASARLMGLLTPAEALPALRYQLLTQSSEPLQRTIVSALSGYGSVLRPYLPQFKLLQRQTPSDALKADIQHLIQKTNGQSSRHRSGRG